MAKSFECPFCNQVFPLTNDTYSIQYPSFVNSHWEKNSYIVSGSVPVFVDGKIINEDETYYPYLGSSGIAVIFYKCPNCDKVSVKIEGCGSQYPDNFSISFYPDSLAKQFAEYVPEAIRQDYEEAYKILHLSPKASATLARRCIHGMICDCFSIKERNLAKAIEKAKEVHNQYPWEAIDSVRQLGNIGAHMESDIDMIISIDPHEAECLVKLVELLINDWYVVPHNRDALLTEIIDINATKQELRKSGN